MTILDSARLSFSINGKYVNFLACKRGDGQGNPLSPPIFCLVEEVLSRRIQNLANSGLLHRMAGPRSVCLPLHAFFSDDLMIYCRGHNQSLAHCSIL